MDIVQQEGKSIQIKSARGTRLQQDARIGLLFLSPWLIGFVLLKALPILAALVFSVTDFQMLTPGETKFIGLENYAHFFRDSVAGASYALSPASSSAIPRLRAVYRGVAPLRFRR